ncbi:sensor histidine kinase [Oceanospirillum linum]|uniref:histidine kinase n=1 Tax=Oceanospirillum linum TaxID=966 RepID=A0A1T1HCC2_OCELI|nr:ATP-binding protein [Oceanospirillum linum]OOV87462.1 hypothetical protein BTA35_0205300 [Oceanospirillum linum]SEF88624.1 Signal transduction histidine kinase [Oleiphilus messinensis]SMP13697.1 Signal transduction histidine kinase [Oceanospirillum linum]
MKLMFRSLAISLLTFFCALVNAKENNASQLGIHLSQWQVLDSAEPLPESEWQSLQNWHPPIWQIPNLKSRWFKAHFQVGWHHKTTSLAITLGPLFSSAEVFVNGVRINSFSDGKLKHFRRSQTQIHPLPSQRLWYSFLDFQKDNELLIHLRSDKEPLTINPDTVIINNYDFLALKAKDSDTLLKIAQGAMIGLLVSFGLFSLFLRAVGFKERDNTLFGLFVTSVALMILSNSLLLPDELGYKLAHSALPWMLASLSVFTLAGLYSEQQKLSQRAKGLLLFNLLILILLILGTPISPETEALKALCLLSYIGVLAEVYWQKIWHKRLLKLENMGVLLVLVGAASDLFWALDYSPVNSLALSLFFVAFNLLFNVALRFRQMAKSLLTLSNRLVSIREIERARLTRDIHDGVGQGLSTLKLLINLNAKKLEPELSETLQTEVAITSNTLKSVIRNLKPIEVASGSPTQSIISLATHNCDLANIRLKVNKQDNVRLSKESAYQVYRIAQEALNNAIKHSEASCITLSLEADTHHFVVTIMDNGKGVGLGQSQHDSYGMNSMQERSMIIGAEISIRNHAEQGTLVCLEVPYND